MKVISKMACFLIMIVGVSSVHATEPLLYGFWNTNAQVTGDFTAKLAPYSNLAFISYGTDIASVPGAIDEAAAHGMKSIVQVENIFFPNGPKYGLSKNYSTLWSAFAQNVMPQVAAGKVASFYVIDEPSLNGVSRQALAKEVSLIRKSFPNIPLTIIYTPGNFIGLDLVDWVGIDCYNNGARRCGNTPYYQAYYNLRSRLSTSQRMVLVPQAGYPRDSGCCNKALVTELLLATDISIGDPKVVAIIPFIWPNIPGFNGLASFDTGPRSLASAFKNVGETYKNDYVFPRDKYKPQFQFLLYHNHFVSSSLIEGLQAGYEFYGIAWFTYAHQIAGTVPLYRCDVVEGNHHFASVYANCETSSAVFEGLYGYVSTYKRPGTSALIRYYNDSTGDYYDTIQPDIVPSAFRYVGIFGYVPSSIVPLPSPGPAINPTSTSISWAQ